MPAEKRHAALLLACLVLYGCPKPQKAPVSSPALAPTAAPSFASVSIPFAHQNSRTPRKYMIETMGAGGGFLDFNNDGWLDILCVNGAKLPGGSVTGEPHLTLLQGSSTGAFEDVTEKTQLWKPGTPGIYGMGVTVADYDRDGWKDIYVSAVLGTGGRLFRNLQGRQFEDVTQKARVANKGNWGTSCAWIDYDKDGWLDLFVCNYVVYQKLQDDKPCFSGDKNVYCIPAAYESVTNTLYHNERDGTFKDVTQSSGIGRAKGKGLGVTVWDYDNNGWPDLFVACDGVAGLLFQNRGDGTFEERGVEAQVAYSDTGVPHSGMGIDSADVRADGTMHLTLTNYFGQQTAYYEQSMPELFADVRQRVGIGPATTRSLGFGIFFFDFDNDGWQDIFQTNGHVQDDIEERETDTPFAQVPLLFQNDGTGRFQEVGQAQKGSPFQERLVGRAAAWGDIDNDGKLDVLVTANNGPARLFKNQTENPAGNWLTLKLKAEKSAPEGIGAEVRVTVAGRTQRTLVRCGSSYMSQSDLRPHFGLGGAKEAAIEIRWPSGVKDTFTTTALNRIIAVHEGRGETK